MLMIPFLLLLFHLVDESEIEIGLLLEAERIHGGIILIFMLLGSTANELYSLVLLSRKMPQRIL